ncbi:MAG: 3-dehydroquinate synthase [Salibacteraceae bacterium]|jgi:3-dehydroquinate synthase
MRIQADSYEVITKDAMAEMVTFINTHYPNSKRYIIADHNTLQHCLPIIDSYLGQLKVEQQVFNIEPGEGSKSMDLAYQLWENFTDLGLSRGDVILNIGGGVVSDLGGFVAATYKRGVDVINVPTTLLAMADAAVGGKVGVNFNQLKNHLGYFSNPKAVFIHPDFLHTLPDREFVSGYAEMIKHALISDKKAWTEMVKQGAPSIDFATKILPASIAIKNEFVKVDPLDKGKRRVLNFGHTMGHAIETLFMDSDTEVLHGEAVAAGMICAAYISYKQCGLSKNSVMEISNLLQTIFDLEFVSWLMAENLALPLKHDKKNEGESLRFVLLTEPGAAVYDQEVSMELALRSFEFVQSVINGEMEF